MIVKESKKMKEALHDDELSDLIDELQTVLDSLDVENSDSDSDALNELCKSLSRSIKMLIDYGFNKAKKVLEDLDIIADSLSELGFDYYAEQIWDIVAPLRQDSFNESKKEDKKINRRSLRESLDVTDVESIYRYIKGNFSGSAEYHDLTTREKLFNFVCDKLADYFGKDIYYDNEQSITDVVDWLWDEKEQESLHESKKINRKALKESEDLANLIAEVKDIKEEAESREDADFLDLADALDSWLSEVNSKGLDREVASHLSEVIDYYEDSNAAGLMEYLSDICKRIIETLYYGRSYNESKKRKVIGKVSMKEAKKALKEDEKGSGELTDYQKSIIDDLAQSDYEVGHPMSEEDALNWFSSGEEDIPVDLAQEAANYYFEAFDQIREDDNSDFEDEE